MFKLTALVENTSSSKCLVSRHGLCLYIETDNHKILFDLGPDKSFIRNAARLGIDIPAVDTVVISHGHHDHGGGLGAFIDRNKTASIYIHEGAFDRHITRVAGIAVNIGLDRSLAGYENIAYNSGTLKIDDELTLFSDVTGQKCSSLANRRLLSCDSGRAAADPFAHEQDLVISAENGDVLLTGCSHRGILNIIDRYRELMPDHKLSAVIGGFHLFDPVSGKCESEQLIHETAEQLSAMDVRFFTCHCTGQKPFALMKDILGSKIKYLSTGGSIEL